MKKFRTKTQSEQRKDLEQKVQEGARRAIREYGEVFKKLAEYDKN